VNVIPIGDWPGIVMVIIPGVVIIPCTIIDTTSIGIGMNITRSISYVDYRWGGFIDVDILHIVNRGFGWNLLHFIGN